MLEKPVASNPSPPALPRRWGHFLLCRGVVQRLLDEQRGLGARSPALTPGNSLYSLFGLLRDPDTDKRLLFVGSPVFVDDFRSHIAPVV